MQINFGARTVSCKIVYYGPGLSGKTTNIQKIHELMPDDRRGELTSIKTEGDRTLFFDFMSLDLGKIAGMETRFQLYTVPGQVYYNATRKLVLQGADGVVFVADSGADRMTENIDSWQNLQENLAENNLSLDHLPVVLQWNKRDLAETLSTEDLDAKLNTIDAPTFESVATTGEGVLETLKSVCAIVCKTINAKQAKATSATGSTRSAATVAVKPPVPPEEIKAKAAEADKLSFVSRRMRVAQTAGVETGEGTAVTALAEPPQTRPESLPAESTAPSAPPTSRLEPKRLLATSQMIGPAGSTLVRALVAAGVVAAGAAVAAVLYGLGYL